MGGGAECCFDGPLEAGRDMERRQERLEAGRKLPFRRGGQDGPRPVGIALKAFDQLRQRLPPGAGGGQLRREPIPLGRGCLQLAGLAAGLFGQSAQLGLDARRPGIQLLQRLARFLHARGDLRLLGPPFLSFGFQPGLRGRERPLPALQVTDLIAGAGLAAGQLDPVRPPGLERPAGRLQLAPQRRRAVLQPAPRRLAVAEGRTQLGLRGRGGFAPSAQLLAAGGQLADLLRQRLGLPPGVLLPLTQKRRLRLRLRDLAGLLGLLQAQPLQLDIQRVQPAAAVGLIGTHGLELSLQVAPFRVQVRDQAAEPLDLGRQPAQSGRVPGQLQLPQM